MKKISDEFKITGRERIRYIKSLNLDPDIDKVDENSPEDFLTQLCRIKNVDIKKVEERLEKHIIMSSLLEENYNKIKDIINNPNIPMREKFEAVGKKRPLYIIPRLLVILEIIISLAILIFVFMFLIPKVVLWISALICAIMLMTSGGRYILSRLLYNFLWKIYSFPFHLWR